MDAQQLAFDEKALATYLEAHVSGFKGPVKATKFSGGQSNPTYLIQAQSGQYVLRRKPPGLLLKSAHAVDREFRVISALIDTDVPVPATYHLCEDDSIIGSMFYLMEYVEGRIYWNPSLPEVEQQTRTAMYEEMNRVLAALHSVNIETVGLSDFGRPGSYFERQLARWSKQYRTSETEHIEAMEVLMTWLQENMPADDGKVALVHGDFRMDNMIFHPQKPRVLAIVDWELSTLGHPFADLAYQCMQWRMQEDNEGLQGLGNLNRTALGIPTEEEYVAQYCKKIGIASIPNWNFYIAFCFFRMAAIVQGIKKRALDGTASSPKAKVMGAMVVPLATMGQALL